MSNTANTLEYMCKLNYITKNSNDVNKLVMEHAKQAKWDPDNFTGEALAFQINTMKKSNPAANQDINIDFRSQDLRGPLKEAEIDRKSLSNNQYRQLQKASLYIETFRPEANLTEILTNAKHNLDKKNVLGNEKIPEDILYSIAFNDGKQMGKHPSDIELGVAVSQSPKAQEVFERYAKGHDIFLESRQAEGPFLNRVNDYLVAADKQFERLMTKVNPHALPLGVQKAGEIAGKAVVGSVIVAVAASAVMTGPSILKDTFGSQQNSYSNHGVEYVINVDRTSNVSDLSENMLSKARLPHDKEDVAAHLEASGIGEGALALAGDEVRLVVPDDILSDQGIDGWARNQLFSDGTFEKEGEAFLESSAIAIPNEIADDHFSSSTRG